MPRQERSEEHTSELQSPTRRSSDLKASGVEKGMDTTPTRNGAVITNQLSGFRVDNKAVVYRGRDFPSIHEGDEVVAAGEMKNGTLQAMAVRNATTGEIGRAHV